MQNGGVDGASSSTGVGGRGQAAMVTGRKNTSWRLEPAARLSHPSAAQVTVLKFHEFVYPRSIKFDYILIQVYLIKGSTMFRLVHVHGTYIVMGLD